MKKYKIIYADPPWTFKNWSDKAKKNVKDHYNTMPIKDIQNLDLESISEDNSVLFLWTTYPTIKYGLETIDKWGFEYKTCAFTWIKLNKNKNTPFVGMGYYTRSNAEICLLATKGNPLPRLSHSVQQIIHSPIEKHSKKPDEVRDRIIELFGDLSRIELFARNKTDGWDVWGDEVENDIELSIKD